METIESRGQLLALILRGGSGGAGVNFVTQPHHPLQLGVMNHPKGTTVRPHQHRARERVIAEVWEVLHIEYGKMEVHFYDSQGVRASTSLLNSGDTILLMSGGHSLNILAETRILEIKQGPYFGVDGDKQYIEVTE